MMNPTSYKELEDRWFASAPTALRAELTASLRRAEAELDRLRTMTDRLTLSVRPAGKDEYSTGDLLRRTPAGEVGPVETVAWGEQTALNLTGIALDGGTPVDVRLRGGEYQIFHADVCGRK